MPFIRGFGEPLPESPNPFRSASSGGSDKGLEVPDNGLTLGLVGLKFEIELGSRGGDCVLV